MCRNSSYCTELGKNPEKWSRTCPLPPPDFFHTSFKFFIAAYELAIQGKILESIAMLEKTESDRLRYWYEEHGQMSGWHHRINGLSAPKKRKYSGPLEVNKSFAKFEGEVYGRDGYVCRYCLNKVIDTKALLKMEKLVGSDQFKVKGKSNRIRHGISLAFRATVDHVKPLSQGGRTELGNLVTSCWSCNYGKTNALLEDMGIEDPFDRPPNPALGWSGLLGNCRLANAQ